MAKPPTFGNVARLWRYPVKSLLGERRDRLDLNARGVAGDRLYAIRNVDGKLASGKNTQRFFRLEGLLAYQAALDGEVPVISFPDGRTLRADQAGIHAALSKAFDQSLTLVREERVVHMDAGAIHLLTTASLEWLKNAIPGVIVDETRFRPNLLVDVPGATLAEQDWMGKTLSIGEEVVVRVSEPTERCAMVSYPQSGLPFDERILRCLAQKADFSLGVYAEVLTPGRIRCGDEVVALA